MVSYGRGRINSEVGVTSDERLWALFSYTDLVGGSKAGCFIQGGHTTLCFVTRRYVPMLWGYWRIAHSALVPKGSGLSIGARAVYRENFVCG